MAAETARALLHDILGPIRPILAREDVTDLCINGPGLLFVEGAHGWERIPADNLTGTWLHVLRPGRGLLHVGHGQRALADPERPPAHRGAGPDRPAAGGRGALDHHPPALACDLHPRRAGGQGHLRAPGRTGTAERGPIHRAAVRARLAGWRPGDQTERPRHPPRDRRPSAERHRLRGHGLGQDHPLQGHDRRDPPRRAPDRHRGRQGAALPPRQHGAAVLQPRRGRGLAGDGQGPAGVVPAHEAGPHHARGAARRRGVLLPAQRQLGAPGLDHDHPRQQRRGGHRAAHADGAPVERRRRAHARGHPRPGGEPGRCHRPDGPQAGDGDLLPARGPGVGAARAEAPHGRDQVGHRPVGPAGAGGLPARGLLGLRGARALPVHPLGVAGRAPAQVSAHRTSCWPVSRAGPRPSGFRRSSPGFCCRPSRCTAPRAWPAPGRSPRPGSTGPGPIRSCSGATGAGCWPSTGTCIPSWPRPRAPARAWASWCRTCCTGRARPSCSTSRARTTP